VDDVADGPLEGDEKMTLLAQARKDLDGLDRATDDAVLVALRDTVSRYPVPRLALRDLVDGVEMDVVGTRYETFDDLLVYCRRVAGAVGRLSLAVFGAADPDAAEERADALGVALQLTNILRDVREDAEMGRLYVPADDLERFGVRLEDPVTGDLSGLVHFEVDRAEHWFSRGLELLPLLDRRSRACTAAMAGIYHRLLVRIARHPEAVSTSRLSLPPWEKAWVAVSSLAGGGP
jgi:phytoene synthase